MVANREACLVLLKAGADVTLRCKGNYRPLHLASTMGVAKALIEHGASPNARTHAGSRPLHYVETPGCVDVLVRYNANVNVTNSYGHTPLHLCLSHGNFSVALRLLAHGASLEASCKPHQYRGPRGVSQMTPLQILDATLQVVSNSKLCNSRKREDIEDLRRCKYLLRTWIEVSKHTKSLERVRIQVERELVMGRFCGVVRCVRVVFERGVRVVFELCSSVEYMTAHDQRPNTGTNTESSSDAKSDSCHVSSGDVRGHDISTIRGL